MEVKMQKQEWTKRDEVDYFLQESLRGCITVERGKKFEGLLLDVLGKIWDEIKERSNDIGVILFADASSLFTLSWPHSYTPADSLAKRNKICFPPGKWIIFFPDSLCDESEAEIKRTIAHEFAHFALGHEGGTNHEEHKKHEKMADDLAAKWGFPLPQRKKPKGDES